MVFKMSKHSFYMCYGFRLVHRMHNLNMLKQLKNILPSIRLTQIPFHKLSGSIALPLSKSFSSNSGDNGSGKNSAKITSWMSTLTETDKERIRYIRNEV